MSTEEGRWLEGLDERTEWERQVAALAASRPGWREYFLGVAQAVAARADCTRRQIGAVLVDSDGRLRGSGYNGSRPGGPSCLAGQCPRGRASVEEVPPGSSYDTGAGACVAIHAELNLILYTSPEERKGGTVYITDEPCDGCLRILQGSGVDRIVWPEGMWQARRNYCSSLGGRSERVFWERR